MPVAETRTHVILPADLIERVDRLVGQRRRSRFFAAAVAKEVERLELLEAARQAAGSLAGVDIPGWETAESIGDWVQALRQEDLRQLDDLSGAPESQRPVP
jgi:hypothetical protein